MNINGIPSGITGRSELNTDNRLKPTSGVKTDSAQQDVAFAQQLETAKASSAQEDRSKLDRAVNEVKTALAPVARNLQFSIDEDTGRTVVKVVDQSTKEVIRQIPSEELLSITRSLDKFSGLFVKQKA